MRRALAASVVALALVAGAATPAQAAPTGSVLVSTDGTAYSASLPGGVFPETTVMVPGASQTAALYVKNDSTVPSYLFVTATGMSATSPDFAKALTLRATSGTTPAGRAIQLGGTATCATLLSESLAPGAVTRLALTLTMADVPAQVAQGESVTAALVLALHEAGTGIAPVSGCDLSGVQLPVLGLPVDGHTAAGGGLAFTGGALLYPALVLVGILLSVGMWLVAAGRRRERRAR
jgi:hypothetical protein